MSTEPAHLAHYAVGALAIAWFWATILRRKGSSSHRLAGRLFFACLLGVLVSVGGIFFLSSRVFAAPEVVQFTYLSLCVVTVGGSAVAAIRLKNNLERFRGIWFRTFGAAAFVMGGTVFLTGVATGQALLVVFSIIGLVYGGAMLRFAGLKQAPHANWWLSWHLNGVSFLFNAVHGTFLAFAWIALANPADTGDVQVVMQLATMAGALGMRIWFGHRYNAPLRFTPARKLAGAPAAGVTEN